MYEKVKKPKKKKKFSFQKKRVSRSLGGDIVVFAFLLIYGLFCAVPLYFTFINAFKPLNELWVFPPRFYVVNPTIKNFIDLFTLMSSSVVPFSRYVFNTFFITVVGTAGQIIVASMCAYPLAKHPFPGSKIFFKIIVLSLMFTPQVTAIPNYLIMSRIGWIDTYWSIIIPVFGSTLGLYLMKQFMEQINDSILESVRIDGAGEWATFWRIVMPQVKPAWLTLIVFSVQALWNMGASVFIYSENLKTFPYALSQIIAAGIARAGVGSAVAVVMLSFPLLIFIATQSNVIETMSTSGLKE